MFKFDVLEQLAIKGADINAIADQLIEKSRQITGLVEALQTEQSAKKFAYEKTLRLVSEKRPRLIYPYFDVFIGLLDSDNSILKWGAIITIGNLAAVDKKNKFEAIFKKYYAPVAGPALVTAGNVIGSSAAIARAKPALADSIACEILKVEKARFLSKGHHSPECRNVAIGHAIDAFDGFFDRIGDKAPVIRFVKRQLNSTRAPVARKAAQFIRKYENSRNLPEG
jgi:hypothetical protein